MASEALSEREVAARVKRSERDVLQQFHGSKTTRIVNSMLQDLDERLRDGRSDGSPPLEFVDPDMSVLDEERIRRLSCQALLNTYDGVLDKEKHWKSAGLDARTAQELRVLREVRREP